MPFKATAKFPGAVAAVTDFGNLQDFTAGTTKPTLAAGITNVATSFSVAAGTGATLPTDNFCITVESEEMFVVTRTTDALSGITRGINGTTAATHGLGIPVNHFITASLINQLSAEVNALQSWQALRLHPDRPPVTANTMDDEFDAGTLDPKWSWDNQGTSTATFSASNLILTVPSHSGDNISTLYQATPATPWEFTAKICASIPNATSFMYPGISVLEGATGKRVLLSFICATGVIAVPWYNSATSFNSYIQNTNAANMGAGRLPLYFKIKNDGTNLLYSFSTDGIVYAGLATNLKTANFTSGPDRVGISAGISTASWSYSLTCDWFRRTL